MKVSVERGLAVVAVLGMLTLAGCAAEPDNAPPAEPASASPAASDAEEYPQEVQDFLTYFGDRYSDPLATYYSEAAYIQKAGVANTLNDGFVSEYLAENDLSKGPEGDSLLLFKISSLDPSAEITSQVFEDQFNAQIPNMNYLLNLLAKNPSPQAVTFIQDQFVDYAGFKNDDAANLVQKFQEFTQRHGSTALYEVLPASHSETDGGEGTLLIDETPFIEWIDENGRTMRVQELAHIAIAVETFGSDGSSNVKTEQMDPTQVVISRAPAGSDPMNIGFTGIGLR